MKRVLRLLAFLMISVLAVAQAGPSTTAVIPSTYFGQTWYYGNPFPVTPAGSYRLWDSNATRWQNMNTGTNTYNFANLDNVLSGIKSNGGPPDVMLTLGATPNYISSDASNSSCEYSSTANGSCGVPTDIAASCTNVNTLNNCDGRTDGTNQSWRSYLYALANHIKGLSSVTYAPVTSIEIWNEFTATNGAINAAWEGSYAQLVLMYQDANCIFTGRGTGCTAAAMGVASVGLIPSMTVLTPNSVMNNTGQANNWGLYVATAGALTNVDVASVHTYTGVPTPTVGERVMSLYTAANGYLVSASSSCTLLPCWSSEGSWGTNASNEPDLDMQAAYVARWYAGGWAAGFKRQYWYAYTANNVGTLWLANGSGGCVVVGGCLTPAGVAYQTTYNWMVGQRMLSLCAVATAGVVNTNGTAVTWVSGATFDTTWVGSITINGVIYNIASVGSSTSLTLGSTANTQNGVNYGNIWTCGLAPAGATLANLMVWDSARSCSSGVCGTTNYTFPAGVGYSSYLKLDGTQTTIVGSTVPIGAKPIMISLGGTGSGIQGKGGIKGTGGIQ